MAGLFESRFNTNPGLKVKQSINFSCLKMFSATYVLPVWSEIIPANSKLREKHYMQKTSPKCYQSGIKILANLGLA